MKILNEILSIFLSLFSKNKETSPPSNTMQSTNNSKKTLVTFEDFVTASGKYPDRLNHPELTEEVKNNINSFLITLNDFLNEMEVQAVEVSSGFRPSVVNAATAGSAKKSLHMIGKAVDFVDPGNKLNDLIVKTHPDLLKKYSLWVEDKGSTKTWCHVDVGNRTDRPLRVFKP